MLGIKYKKLDKIADMTYIVASFYKYIGIDSPLKLRNEQFELCKLLDLKGRILIGGEGINGSVYGTKTSVEKYKEALKSNNLFLDMEFKEQIAEKQAFRKLHVRVRKEIVHSGLKVDLKNTANFLSPRELKELLDKNEELILVDVRNDYESRIGKFKGAVTLNIKNFRDFPKAVKEIENLKDKKIVTYCTGGIRCEKASAFLKKNGFKNVYQIKGGILNYGKEFPDTYWLGSCFVFDDRLSIPINKNNTELLAECEWCGNPCNEYTNCHNLECDRLFISCEECRYKHNASCSESCSKAPKRRKENHSRLQYALS